MNACMLYSTTHTVVGNMRKGIQDKVGGKGGERNFFNRKVEQK